ncbi:glycosyltransferase family 2 protein [Desulfopila sp. IMCC35008]|uniref:glycosyltransferase family 2 protein n=1 Tax=Desulfopila sp. IMCC35008 TaxID=2653858 RepID=UPI0013D766D7|nr:glycosyltransferase [Desulfopila sp. IMCC35008]
MNTCPEVLAVIVTHNSETVLPLCLKAIGAQEDVLCSVSIVDCGSADTSYLYSLQTKFSFELVEESNIGFSRANNKGCESASSTSEFVVFLNPDTILPRKYLSQAVEILTRNPQVAIVSGILEGYDPQQGTPTGLVDSTGVFRKWYGRWYDRNQGEPLQNVSLASQELPAVCGALMVCRKEALRGLGSDIFDNDFFLYKEDIELSLRLRKRGWKLLFTPNLHAYHCRGWQMDRGTMSLQTRLTAARSEVLLYRKHPSPYMVWAVLKYIAVRWFRM